MAKFRQGPFRVALEVKEVKILSYMGLQELKDLSIHVAAWCRIRIHLDPGVLLSLR